MSHPLDAIVDRPRHEAALALASAWLGMLIGLVIGGETADVGSLAIAGIIGAALVFFGFAAASRCRALPRHTAPERARIALLSMAAGVVLGVANLAANLAIAAADPRIRELLIDRMATLELLVGLVASPLVEEIGVRLFLMSVLAWVVSRFAGRATLAFVVALVGSSVFFALLHLDRPLPDDQWLTNFYRATLLTKYTLAGLPLGWIFWRWGLPYSILCHVAANAVHLALQTRVF